jgi:hypothetical protein
MRGLLSSPLVVVGKGLKLTRDRSVGHGLGSAKQSICCFQVFLASAIWSQGSQFRSLARRALK